MRTVQTGPMHDWHVWPRVPSKWVPYFDYRCHCLAFSRKAASGEPRGLGLFASSTHFKIVVLHHTRLDHTSIQPVTETSDIEAMEAYVRAAASAGDERKRLDVSGLGNMSPVEYAHWKRETVS